MKRLAAAAILILTLALLAGCGGSSESSTGGESSANGEAEWTAEVEGVLKEGEKATGGAERRIDSAKTRKELESAYRTYAGELSRVASKLRDTEAPSACSSVKSHVVSFLQEFGSITGELGQQSSMNEKQFDSLVKQDTSAAQAFAGMMEQIGRQGHC